MIFLIAACHVGLSLVAKNQTTNAIVLVLSIVCVAHASVLLATALIRKNFMFQMGVTLGHLNRKLNVVDLKVPETLKAGKKIRVCACAHQGG